MPEIQEGSGRASPHPPAMDHHFPSDNALFNKYELGKLLGRGAFAKVYYAKNIANGQGVAIKVINKSQISANLNLMANIKREISIMSKLRHPNIVKLLEVLATRTKIYFVMEYVKGGELFAKIAKGRFGEDLSRKYFQEMISAVSYCHSRGVYHRDLKPENLLLDENGNLKVSDFGLGALTDQVRPDGLLHTLCGTPAYVAPEILSKKGYKGAHVDVWSCGIVLYVLTAGFLPFNDSNVMNMYKKIYRGEFRCPKWMSPDLKRFLSRLLNTNPRTRITIEEIKRDPWFKKGYKDVIMKFDDQVEQDFGRFVNAEDKKLVDLNAFDIISFSSGLDLSGLFDERCRAVADVERLSVEDTPESVLQKVEEVVKGASCGLRVRKLRECGVEVERQDGNFVMGVDVYRLADRLTVVEVRRKGGDADVLWREKIRPVIIEQRELQVAGC